MIGKLLLSMITCIAYPWMCLFVLIYKGQKALTYGTTLKDMIRFIWKEL